MIKMLKLEYKAHLAIMGANIIWGFFSPVSKLVLATGIISATTLTNYRMIGAAILFWIASLFVKERMPWRDVFLCAIAGLFGIVLNQSLFMIGLSYTSPINSTIISTSSPLFAMILAAIFIHEPITFKKVIGVLIGASGAIILILSGQYAAGNASGNYLLGNSLCLLAQIFFAFYLVMFKKVIGRYHPVTFMKWAFTFSALFTIPFNFNELISIDYASFSTELIWQIIFVVVGATFLSYILITYSQRTLRPTLVGMYTNIQPIVASIIAIYIGLDTFGWQKAISIVLIFLGVYTVTKSKRAPQN